METTNLSTRKTTKPTQYFALVPDEVTEYVLSFLDGEALTNTRAVCRRWDAFCRADALWKLLSIRHCPALAYDVGLCGFFALERERELERKRKRLHKRSRDVSRRFNSSVEQSQSQSQVEADETSTLISKTQTVTVKVTVIPSTNEQKWQATYPQVVNLRHWTLSLKKSGLFLCNVIAYQIAGRKLSDSPGIPDELVIERRFNVLHIEHITKSDEPLLYLQPATQKDKVGFDGLIRYLSSRSRAGLCFEEKRRFLFIPPCEYARKKIGYDGNSLLCLVQNATAPTTL